MEMRTIASGNLLHSNNKVTGRVLPGKGGKTVVALLVKGRKVFVKADTVQIVRAS